MFMDYWYRLLRSNRALNDDTSKMTITVSAFKEQIRKAFEEGKAEGLSERPAVDDPFRKMFGM